MAVVEEDEENEEVSGEPQAEAWGLQRVSVGGNSRLPPGTIGRTATGAIVRIACWWSIIVVP